MTNIARKCIIKGCPHFHRSKKGTCLKHRKQTIDKNEYTVDELIISFGCDSIPDDLYIFPDLTKNKIKND